MLALIASIFTATAIAFGALAVLRRPRPAAMRVADLKAELVRQANSEEQSFGDRVLLPAARGLGRMLTGLLPTRWLSALDDLLVAAGRPFATHELVLVLTAVSASLGIVAAFVAANAGIGPFAIFAAAGGVAAGLLLPLMWIRRLAINRRADIWQALPDASDLLTTCVEAGMSLDAAFGRVAAELPGPLAVEFHTMLREVALGKPRHDAFVDIGKRTGVSDLSGFIAAIIQADQTGTALAPVLRAQSRHIRIQRKLTAEEQARKVPAKMVIPMVLLIVPTLFILILGPLALELIDTFE